jgi:hypothetical protein
VLKDNRSLVAFRCDRNYRSISQPCVDSAVAAHSYVLRTHKIRIVCDNYSLLEIVRPHMPLIAIIERR